MLESYRGAYSTQDLMRRGMSSPGQASAKKRYWLVWEAEDYFRVQALSSSFEPVGGSHKIGRAEFSARFALEPDIQIPEPSQEMLDAQSAAAIKRSRKAVKVNKKEPKTVQPAWVRLDEGIPSVKRGVPEAAEETPREQPARKPAPEPAQEPAQGSGRQPFSGAAAKDDAESRAQRVEKNMRADFATALARLRIGQKERALSQIEALLAMERPDEPAFRHMFTEFGINLRKSSQPEMALRSHLEARQISPTDSHILFNAARAAYDMGDMQKTREFLIQSLVLTPDLKPAQRFLDFVEKKKEK